MRCRSMLTKDSRQALQHSRTSISLLTEAACEALHQRLQHMQDCRMSSSQKATLHITETQQVQIDNDPCALLTRSNDEISMPRGFQSNLMTSEGMVHACVVSTKLHECLSVSLMCRFHANMFLEITAMVRFMLPEHVSDNFNMWPDCGQASKQE